MFSNKTIIITGASSGMGKAMANAFLKEGANIVVNARNKERLEDILHQNEEHASRIKVVVGDIGLKSTGENLASTHRCSGFIVYNINKLKICCNTDFKHTQACLSAA